MAGASLGVAGWAEATAVIEPPFAGRYSASDVALPFSGPSLAMTFKAGDPNTLLIGADYPQGGGNQSVILAVPVVRGGDGHVSGFGTPTLFATAPGPTNALGMTAGLGYGPGGTLFYTYFDSGSTGIGEIVPGGTGPARFAAIPTLPPPGQATGLAFVPAGFDGEGELKVTGHYSVAWYDVSLVSRGDGTYDIGAAVQQQQSPIATTPSAVVYVKALNAGFITDAVLVGDMDSGRVYAYYLDTHGDLSGSLGLFATLTDSVNDYAAGGTTDPLTGDVLFLGNDHVTEVRGFAVPEPAGIAAAAGAGIALLGGRRRSRRRRDR
jgi:hypothetical protein